MKSTRRWAAYASANRGSIATIAIGIALLVTFGVEGMATATRLAVVEVEALEEEADEVEAFDAPVASPPALTHLPETGRGEPNLVRHVIHRHEEERR